MRKYICYLFFGVVSLLSCSTAQGDESVYRQIGNGTHDSPEKPSGNPERSFRNRYGMIVDEYKGALRFLKRETALKAVLGPDVYDLEDVLKEYRYVPEKISPDSYTGCVSSVEEYKVTGDGSSLRLEIELPKETDGPVPYIIWIHGGGWHSGSPASMKDVSRYFASAGFASFRVQYRLRGAASTNEEQLQDIADAVAYIRNNASRFNVNPDVYAYIGGSAGGQLALISGINDSECDAIVPMFAVYDVKGFYNFLVSVGQRNEMDDVVQAFFMMEDDIRYMHYNPCDAVKKDMAPTLVLHGTGDSTAPYAHCERFIAKMKEYGNPMEIGIFERYEHNFTGKGASDAYETVQLTIRAFLEKNLK